MNAELRISRLRGIKVKNYCCNIFTQFITVQISTLIEMVSCTADNSAFLILNSELAKYLTNRHELSIMYLE